MLTVGERLKSLREMSKEELLSLDIMTIIADISTDSYENGYDAGFKEGIEEGRRDGYIKGHNVGYDNGKMSYKNREKILGY